MVAQELMGAEVEAHLGADCYKRTAERSGKRNGYRSWDWDPRVGSIPLRVPPVRDSKSVALNRDQGGG